MDECPTCSYGQLDLSPSLFNHFANPDDGIFEMTWDYVN
jgi:expansin (peptidoglycan-binding protein)